jgi:hypothetical protein
MLLNGGLSGVNDWKKLYSAALLQKDKSTTPLLIAEAQRAIVERARQLFKSPTENLQEERELDIALSTLNVLKSCLVPYRKLPRLAEPGATYSVAR